MRLAYFSPLNPIPSGISDYSEELLPLIARRFDVTLVVDDFTPSNPALSQWPLLRADEFRRRPTEFDLILYHMGNSPAHSNIYRTLLEIPGVVVMHDVVLHHLRAWQTLDRHDAKSYVRAMGEQYGEGGAELAQAEARVLAALDRFDFPLNGDVARAARGIIVHSEYAARCVQPLAPATPLAVVPMGVPPAKPISAAEGRTRLSLPQDAFVVAAFGDVHPNKRVTVALEAFAEFHGELQNALFLLVGRESPNFDAAALIAGLHLEQVVRQIGFAPRDVYDDCVAAADLCLNLRYPSAGETSASLLRLFSAGKAVVVTRTGAYAELPDAVCAKIEADEYERDLIKAHLGFFARRPDARARLGANARDFAASCHTLEQSASAYNDFLQAVHEERAQSKSYLARWSGNSRERVAVNGEAQAAVQPPAGRVQPIENGEPVSTAVSRDLHNEIARAYVELGYGAEDDTLRSVALANLELGLDGEKTEP